MFKVITLLKRRAGLTLEQFIELYEKEHAVLGAEKLRGHVVHYERRYLHPLPSTRPAAARDPDYDVVMEAWYEDRAAYDRSQTALREASNAEEIAADEERLFDRSMIRSFSVEEHETDMTS